jgi:predicted amidophosphoribosyltransferase
MEADMGFLDLIFPQDNCEFCGQPVHSVPPWTCDMCLRQIRLSIPDNCGELKIHPFEGFFLGAYSGFLKYQVDRFRNEGKRALARPFGGLLAEKMINLDLQKTAVVPVPSYRLHSRLRGYNPGVLLADWVGKCLDLPKSQALACHEINPSESDDHDEKTVFLKKAFWVRDTSKITGRRVILVDDVCLTGLTLKTAGEKLLDFGAQQVTIAVIAVANQMSK